MGLSTSQIHAAMREKYSAPEWGILFEVGNATGYGTNRHADAIAMSLWPSRGLTLHGFEFKASRSDWVKELKDPSKAEPIAAYCDFWWLVVGDKEIVKPGELPASWGLIAPKGDKLTCCKEAMPNAAPKEVNRPFLAALFRRIHEQAQAPDKEVRQKGYEEGYARGKEHAGRTMDRLQKDHAALLRSIEDFRKRTGVHISAYNGPHMAEQFNRCFQPRDYHADLRHLLAQATQIRSEIAKSIAQTQEEIAEYII